MCKLLISIEMVQEISTLLPVEVILWLGARMVVAGEADRDRDGSHDWYVGAKKSGCCEVAKRGFLLERSEMLLYGEEELLRPMERFYLMLIRSEASKGRETSSFLSSVFHLNENLTSTWCRKKTFYDEFTFISTVDLVLGLSLTP
jgi:hypothetical protein